jgi:protein O-GlcNAc transferase
MNIPQTLELARKHQQAGRTTDAESLYRQILGQHPQRDDVLQQLGILLFQSGRAPDAEQLFRRAIAANFRKPEYHYQLALVLQSLGRTDDAIKSLNQAIGLRPSFAEPHNDLGIILLQRKKPEEAILHFKLALAAKHDFAAAQSNLGIALADQARYPEALAAFRRALELRPDHFQSFSNLSNALRLVDEPDQAVAAARRALELRPDYAPAYNNLGNALNDLNDPDAAAAACQKAIDLRPDFSQAWNNLGMALRRLGRTAEAAKHFERAVELAPDEPAIRSNHIFSLYYFQTDLEAIVDQTRQWDRRHAQQLRHLIKPHTSNPDPNRPLRIGYVSADFRDHASAFFLWPLLTHHNRQEFEITCYAQVHSPDSITQRFQSLPLQWRNIAGVSDDQVAEQIRQDQIDILVDLKLHTAENRLGVFARKPAPIQISWLGVPTSPGLSTIDYRLTDRYLEPPGQTNPFPDQPYHLPDCFWCYDPLTTQPPVNDLPALQNGFITFGCLNSFWKLTESTLRHWAAVLDRIPGSRILLLTPVGSARQTVHGILGTSRVDFVPNQSRDQYLQTYHRIDLALDTLPYNGHTTTLDSLWMGVPVITQVGLTSVGRAGWSLLNNLGLPELAAHDPSQFIQIAVDWAANLPRLADLRANLRSRLMQSPLADAPRFARSVESAYRDIWRSKVAPTAPVV